MTHDEATMEVVIHGHIPSVNKLYDLHKPVSAKDTARIYVSKQGKRFKSLFAKMAEAAGLREAFDAHGLRDQLLEITVILQFPRVFEKGGVPVKVDADNPIKALFDGLSAAFGVDDSWFFKYDVEKRKGGRKTIVRIRPYVPDLGQFEDSVEDDYPEHD